MQVSTPRHREWSSLPSDIQSAMTHHLCDLTFEQMYTPTSQRTEPSAEFLHTWCEQNLKQIFSTEKLSYQTWRFLFWSREDFDAFLNFLKSPNA